MIPEYFLVHKNEQLKSIIEKIVINSHRAVIVVDKKKVIGLISEGDILKSLVYKKDLNELLARRVYRRDVSFGPRPGWRAVL